MISVTQRSEGHDDSRALIQRFCPSLLQSSIQSARLDLGGHSVEQGIRQVLQMGWTSELKIIGMAELVCTAKMRWRIERDCRELKQ
jgi:hypothetical protein